MIYVVAHTGKGGKRAFMASPMGSPRHTTKHEAAQTLARATWQTDAVVMPFHSLREADNWWYGDKGEMAPMELAITDTERVDWLIRKSGADFGYDHNKPGNRWLVCWVCNGEKGNENGGGSTFIAEGATERECIDKFITGDIRCIR